MGQKGGRGLETSSERMQTSTYLERTLVCRVRAAMFHAVVLSRCAMCAPSSNKLRPIAMDIRNKATAADLFSLKARPIRAFYTSWFAFFLCFSAWFGGASTRWKFLSMGVRNAQ